MKADIEVPASSSLQGKYLTVLLGDEFYGISVLKVREIIRNQRINAIPQLPESVRGVINLRGRVIPIVDLRIRFGLHAQDTEHTCIVVVQIGGESGAKFLVGLIVASVEEVATIRSEQIEPTPNFGIRCDTSFLLGMAKSGKKVISLLDIQRIVTTDTAHMLEDMLGSA